MEVIFSIFNNEFLLEVQSKPQTVIRIVIYQPMTLERTMGSKS